MAAYGAELISVPAGKMEMARDLAARWRHAGRVLCWTSLGTSIIPSRTIEGQVRHQSTRLLNGFGRGPAHQIGTCVCTGGHV